MHCWFCHTSYNKLHCCIYITTIHDRASIEASWPLHQRGNLGYCHPFCSEFKVKQLVLPCNSFSSFHLKCVHYCFWKCNSSLAFKMCSSCVIKCGPWPHQSVYVGHHSHHQKGSQLIYHLPFIILHGLVIMGSLWAVCNLHYLFGISMMCDYFHFFADAWCITTAFCFFLELD